MYWNMISVLETKAFLYIWQKLKVTQIVMVKDSHTLVGAFSEVLEFLADMGVHASKESSHRG